MPGVEIETQYIKRKQSLCFSVVVCHLVGNSIEDKLWKMSINGCYALVSAQAATRNETATPVMFCGSFLNALSSN